MGVNPNLNVVHSTQDKGTGLDMGSPKLGLKFGEVPTEASKQKKTNRISCKGNKGSKLTTKTPNAGKDSNPSMGKVKQGT